MLSRFLAAKNDEKKKPKEKRPFLASECRDLADADKWRQQIIREIGRKVMDIQNPGLGEHRIRDLNDEINKLIREKGHWETRILELGGPNYAKTAPKITGEDGKEIDVASGKGMGYRYFGAAKQLPGVKELFELPPEIKRKRNRYEMYKRIDMDYYGFRDDEDGVLENLEKDAEKEMRAQAIEEWERIEAVKAEARKGVKEVVVMRAETDDKEVNSDLSDEDVDEDESERRPKRFEFVAHVPLPDEKEIERMVVEKKKQELLSKYASDDLVKEELEAKEMLNIHR